MGDLDFWTGDATRMGTGGGNFVVDHVTRDDPVCVFVKATFGTKEPT